MTKTKQLQPVTPSCSHSRGERAHVEASPHCHWTNWQLEFKRPLLQVEVGNTFTRWCTFILETAPQDQQQHTDTSPHSPAAIRLDLTPPSRCKSSDNVTKPQLSLPLQMLLQLPEEQLQGHSVPVLLCCSCPGQPLVSHWCKPTSPPKCPQNKHHCHQHYNRTPSSVLLTYVLWAWPPHSLQLWELHIGASDQQQRLGEECVRVHNRSAP